MAYIVNKTDGNIAAVVEDGTINTETSLKIVGTGYLSYGETIAEDLVALLENFSSSNPPGNPIKGQLWYNKTDGQIQVYNGSRFTTINNVNISASEPSLPVEGNFWYNSTKRQLFFRKGSNWQLIAPAYSNDQGRSEVAIETITDTLGVPHTATVFYCSGIRMFIVSADAEYSPDPVISGYSFINPGLNIPYFAQTPNNFYWAANGNAFSSGSSTVPGGNDTQIQYNANGFLGGATGLTTNGTNLISTGLISGSTIQGGAIRSTSSGFIFPDNTVQSTAASVNEATLFGTGGTNELAYFNDDHTLTSSNGLATDGNDLTVSGQVSGATIRSTSSGVYFPDGSLQTTAAFNNSGAVNGTGTSGQLSYFNSSNTVTGTSGITTNGLALTINGLLSVGANGIKFADNTIMTTAPTDQTGNILSKISGGANTKELAYFSGPKTISGANNILVEGNEIKLLNGSHIECYNDSHIHLRDNTELLLENNAKITFADGTIQQTSGIGQVLKNASGYQKIPNGMIIQWGTGNTVTGLGDTVNFPIAFPAVCTSVTVNEANAVGWIQAGNLQPTIYGVTSITKNNFKVYGARLKIMDSHYHWLSGDPDHNHWHNTNIAVAGGGLTYNWIAVGY